MSVREYIGARYIHMFADPIEWDSSLVYEPLTVVQYEGGSYVSRREVPAGIELSNTDYWILWADFNAQLQHYIDVVNTFDGRIDSLEDALPIADFDSVDTVDARFDAIEAKLPASDFDSTNTIKAAIDAEVAARSNADDVFTQDITDINTALAKTVSKQFTNMNSYLNIEPQVRYSEGDFLFIDQDRVKGNVMEGK